MNCLSAKKVPVIDLRSTAIFNQLHIIDSASFPVAELANRLHELPIKTQAISLFGEPHELIAANKLLTDKGFLILNQQIATQEKLQELAEANLLQPGNDYTRLWRPAKIVEQFIEEYSCNLENKTGLDIACGSGRDSVYMASHGWHMTGVDYSPSALLKMSDLAKRNGQTVVVRQLDLEKLERQRKLFLKAPFNCSYGCVVVVRYLHRPLLLKLKSLIEAGGYIVYQTFMQGCEQFGSPKNPRFLLESGELARIFEDFELLVDKVEYLPDGRPTNRFIARKR